MCCRLLGITEIDKPQGFACPHASDAGCAIYATRPYGCREFYCGWLALLFVGEHWRPDACGMVIFPDAANRNLTVHVDPANPAAWQAEPFRTDLAQWSVAAERMGLRLAVAAK